MNIELAEMVLKHVQNNPSMHEQDMWFNHYECGTTACLAGWTCLLNGDKPYYSGVGQIVETKNGDLRQVYPRAMELLGISKHQARVIFYEMNEAKAIEMFEALIARKRMGTE